MVAAQVMGQAAPDRHLATRPRSARLHAFTGGSGHFVLDVEGGAVRSIPASHAGLLHSALAADVDRAELTATALGLINAKVERADIPRSVAVKALSLAVAQKCNLGCTYCYAQQGTFGSAARSMELDVAYAAVDRLLEEAPPGEPITLAFMGGEPLANRKVLHASTRHAARQAAARGIPIGFSMTTNGTLVSEEDIALFQEFCFTLTVSIDGMQATHDKLRPLRSGKGSFERVERGVAALMAVQGRRYRVSARVTVTPFNLDLAQTLSGLVHMGFDGIMFSPMLSAPTGKAQMGAEDLDRLLDELQRCGDIVLERLRHGEVLPFTNLIKTLQRIHAYERDTYPCGAGGGYMGVSADGGLFACHRFVDDEDGRMGDIAGGIDDAKRVLWLTSRHLENQSPCNGCWARYLCSGSCHYEAMKRGRPACDYIRGWLHYCLGVYADLRQSPRQLEALLAVH